MPTYLLFMCTLRLPVIWQLTRGLVDLFTLCCGMAAKRRLETKENKLDLLLRAGNK